MKKQLFSFLFLIAFSLNLSAQTVTPDASDGNLRKHVSYLASDKLEGRRTGETGAVAAAGYVANMFANFKLKGGFLQNGKASFLQPFPFAGTVSLGAENRLMLTGAGSNRLAELKTDWMPFGASPNARLENVETVFAGYGIVASDAKRDDYAQKDISGKIVVAFEGNPEKDNPHSVLARFNAHAKAKLAKDKGALGLILISAKENFADDKNTKLDYDQTLGETAISVLIVSKDIGKMFFADAETMSKAEKGETVEAKNFTLNAKISLNKVSGQSYNVIGILEGRDFSLKNEAIVIGAHYDHLGRGGAGSLALNSTEIHHGADDNASGVAAMLEIAREFSKNKNNKRTLIFIAFGGEEEGLIGSKFYVNNPVFPLAKTVAMLNMDMVGRLKDNKLTIGGIGTASEWRNLVEGKNNSCNVSIPTKPELIEIKTEVEQNLRKASLTNVTVSVGDKDEVVSLCGVIPKGRMAEAIKISQEISGKPTKNELIEGSFFNPSSKEIISSTPFTLQLNEDGFGPSDHSSFYGKQIPVLFFFTGTHPDYHKPSDTAEKINYQSLNQIKNYVSEIVKAVDQNPQKPTYTVAKSSGMGTGRTGFSVSLGTIPSYAESNDGMTIDGVRDNSPASKAGLKSGDKIIKLAGKEVRNVSDYTVVLGEMKADTEYEIVVMRGAEKLIMKIIPAARK